MPEKPTQLENVDLTRLRRECQEYIDHVGRYGIDEFGIDDRDRFIEIEHVIALAALDAIFGDDHWMWLDSRTRQEQ